MFDMKNNISSKHTNPTDIVLFLPNMSWFNKRVKYCIPFTAITLTSILIQAELDFHLIDATIGKLSEKECFDKLKKLNPKIVLLSSISTAYYMQTHKAAELVKKANADCITVHGGVYATTMPYGAMEDENTDYIFLGPAEGRLPHMIKLLLSNKHDEVRKLEGIGYRTGDNRPIITGIPNYAKLKQAVDPDYSKVDIKAYLNQKAAYVEHPTNFMEPTAVIQASFGCCYNCVFCATQTLSGRRVAYREIESVLDEIGWFYSEFDIRHFGFIDELLLLNKKRAMALFQGIVDRKYKIKWKLGDGSLWHMSDDILEMMKMSGCVHTGMSCESGCQRVLDEIMNKPLNLEIVPHVVQKCKELGMTCSSNFVIGLPGEKWDEILQTVDFADKLDLDLVIFNIAQPFAGTPLAKICIEQGLISPNFDFRNEKAFANSQGFITTDEFTPPELMAIRSMAWDWINFKSHDKKARAARCLNIPIDKIDEHRRISRRNLGVHAARQEIT